MSKNREKDNVIDDSGLWQAVERARERRRALGIEEPETDFSAAIEKWKERQLDVFQLRLEMEPVVPDTVASLQSRLRDTIDQVIAASGLDALLKGRQPQPTFAQPLPTPEGLEIVIAFLAFAVQVTPLAWPHLKAFLTQLGARLSQATPLTIKADITIGEKKVQVKGLTPEDAMRVITEEYEVYFQPRAQG